MSLLSLLREMRTKAVTTSVKRFVRFLWNHGIWRVENITAPWVWGLQNIQRMAIPWRNWFKRRMRRFLKQNAPERIVSVLTVMMWGAALIIDLIWKRTCAMQQRIPVRNLRCITSLLWIWISRGIHVAARRLWFAGIPNPWAFWVRMISFHWQST